MDVLLNIINSDAIGRLLGTGLFVFSCFIMAVFLIVSLLRKDFVVLTVKMMGALMICGLALFSNNVVTYCLAVIIIGTFIADPKFLERISAIFTKNKEYFLSNASEEDRKNKIQKEIEKSAEDSLPMINFEEIKSNAGLIQKTTSFNEKIVNAIRFEEEALHALTSEKGLFLPEKTRKNIIIEDPNKKRIMLDAVAEGNSALHYAIEIKDACNAANLYKSVEQLRSYSNTYRKYLKSKGLNAVVKGLLIIPSHVELKQDSYDGFKILKFDQENKAFTNRDEVNRWMIENTES